MDQKLKKILNKQLLETRELTGQIIADLKNPRYSSGRLIKINDRPLFLLEFWHTDNSNYTILLEDGNSDLPTARIVYSENVTNERCRIILLHEEEIDEYCRNYLYIGGDQKSIRVIKKPKDMLI